MIWQVKRSAFYFAAFIVVQVQEYLLVSCYIIILYVQVLEALVETIIKGKAEKYLGCLIGQI